MRASLTWGLVFRIIAAGLFLPFGWTNAWTQFNPLDYTQLTQAKGLPASPVSGMVQDHRGYIWIGTSTGLFRYNGMYAKAYVADGSLKGLPENKIQQLECFDRKVVGLTHVGAFIHDCTSAHDTSIFLQGQNGILRFLINKMVHACGDGQGGMILLSTAGFLHIDSNYRRKFEYVHPDPAGWPAVSGSFGRVVFLMGDGHFIINGADGWFVYDPEAKTVSSLHSGTYPGLDPFIQDPSVYMFATGDNEFLLLSRRQGKMAWLDLDRSRTQIISVKESDISVLRWTTKLCARSDSLYYLLQPGKGSRILRLDRNDFAFSYSDLDTTGLPVYALFVDRDQRTWVGTNNGVFQQRSIQNRIRKSAPAYDAGLPEKSHTQFVIAGPYLVTGTAEGRELKFYNKYSLQEEFNLALPLESQKPQSTILHFTTYGRDSLLVCTRDSRYFINWKSRKVGSGDYDFDGQSGGAWYAMESVRDGSLYTLDNGSRLQQYNPLKKRFESVSLEVNVARKLRVPTQLAEDWEGNIWISHNGFCRYNPREKKVDFCRDYFPGSWQDINLVGNFVMDPDAHRIWFILQHNGLIRYNPSYDTYQQFTMKDGLPENLNCGLLLAGKHIWMITPSGLAAISTEDFTVHRYPYGQGAGLQFNRKALTYDAESDQLYFMEGSEIMACQPSALLSRMGKAQLYIEKIDEGGLTRNWPEQSGISVRGKNRKIRIKLSAVSFEETSSLQFSFRHLQGRDTAWYNLGADGVAYIENLPPGEHRVQFRVVSTGNDVPAVTKDLKIRIYPVWSETWYSKALLAMITFGLIWYSVRWLSDRKKEKQMISHQMTELELQALRSRMNPHFIFNCLNSINRYILKAETQKASYYLSRFSVLIRHILDFSTETTISLAEELRVSRLYIELESLRMTQSIQTEIDLGPGVEEEHIRVPPLCIQPYIENAIWHGLAPKKVDLRLTIRVFLEADTYSVEIEDNGIGRAMSQQAKRPGQHESKGLLIARETFERYGKVSKMKTSVDILDLKTPDGSAAGTKVVLKFKPLN